jgi:Uma2 family endonuclease
VATVPSNGYPTSDGKPMAETDLHRDLMLRVIDELRRHFAADPLVYVSGNLLVFYEEGDRRRHVAPDVFMVRGVPKHRRDNYLVWEEGRGPQVVIELTSSSTRRTDLTTKRTLYQDTLRISEYFIFDPRDDYLDPRLQGFRLRGGVYRPIRLVNGRLASRVLGLHLEAQGEELRFFNPHTEQLLPTAEEVIEQADQRAEQADQRAEHFAQENERLRRELDDLRRRHSNDSPRR